MSPPVPEPHQVKALNCSGKKNSKDPHPASLIESRTVEPIPRNERHGKLLSQFTLWAGGNLQITASTTGAITVMAGGDVIWSLAGLLTGQIAGALIMALHARQGPRLGLPQMIISRKHFGLYGSLLPLMLALIMYTGFSASGTVLAGQALATLLSISDAAGILIFSSIIIVLATCGYRVIHKSGKLATVSGVLMYGYLLSCALTPEHIQFLMTKCHFSLPSFLLAMSLSSSWQIAFCPYVSDYSRYLPPDTSSVKLFWAVFTGTVLGSQLSMTIGVIAAALAGPVFSDNTTSHIAALGTPGLMVSVIYAGICFGKVTFTTLNTYGSFMTGATMLNGLSKKTVPGDSSRVVFIIAIVSVSCITALLAEPAFIRLFTDFLLLLLVFFVPWSAITLTDDYLFPSDPSEVARLVSEGGYDKWHVKELFVYCTGLLVQLPFIENPLMHGSLTWLFGGNDISWLTGWLITATLWYSLKKCSMRN